MTVVIVSILAGLFAGLSLGLFFYVLHLESVASTLDIERKRWVNKAMIRDGQARIFPDSEIEPDTEPTEKLNHEPLTFKSPFQAGKAKLAEQVKEERQKENGSHLPLEVKAHITQAAQRVQGS